MPMFRIVINDGKGNTARGVKNLIHSLERLERKILRMRWSRYGKISLERVSRILLELITEKISKILTKTN